MPWKSLLPIALLPLLFGAMAAGEAPEPVATLSDGRRLTLPETDARIPSPAAFLGRPVGAGFTSHERLLAYYGALAEASERVRILDYGTSYEGRPLRLVVISSAANLARLEELRAARLRLSDLGLADPNRERLVAQLPVAVWLAYGVHGNESSSAEAAMLVAHSLAAASGDLAAVLDSTIVLLDPLVNPDGRERYLAAYRSRRGRQPDPDPQAAEHREPWPGGRENHYFIDLNRDWAWATQRETVARLAAYRAWEPQVYVDFHEMRADALTYFFPPAAEPINPLIEPRVLSWLKAFGRANAAAFDGAGWTYFAHETYDLFYPGYGDSYPSLRGAVGMTYEVAGGGAAGELVRLPDGSLMTLADRIARHTTASLATVRTAAGNRARLLADFVDSQHAAAAAAARTYLWRADQPEAAALAELLRTHGVRVEELSRTIEQQVRPLGGGEESRRELPAGTFAVSTVQPLGNLVRALLSEEVQMSDTFVRAQRRRIEENRPAEFYDVTAWSLPLAFNLETWVADGTPAALRPLAQIAPAVGGAGEVGYLLPPQGLSGYGAAARLLRRGVTVRLALEDFRNGGKSYPSGTLFVPRYPNPGTLDAEIADVVSSFQVSADRVASSYSEQGSSLGSESVIGLRLPRVALVRGDGVSSGSFGALWHLLGESLELAPTPVETRSLRDGDLGRYDAIVLPDGGYDGLDDQAAAHLRAFVESGGVLVAIGGGVEWAKRHELTSVKFWEPPKPDEEDDEGPALSLEAAVADRPLDTPGAVLSTDLRRSHPLAAGLSVSPPVLFSGSDLLLASNDPQVDILVARRDRPVQAGFAWPEARERLSGALLVGVEKLGKGEVILFAQDPAFRLFWRATMPLFLNAVLYEPSRHGRGR